MTSLTTQQGEKDRLVEIRKLVFGYAERKIFSGFDIDIRRGQVTAIMGPSGTGKTTLLRMIGGQLAPQSGQVIVDGLDVVKLSRKELYKLRRRIGMLFQNGALFTGLNVYDNVAFPLREHTQLPETMIRDIVLIKLEAVGLRGGHALMPNELSGGMARRVALARAIALDPMVIMYDEPFTGLDPITVGVVMQLIRKLNDALGLTSIIISHDVQEICAISDYLYLLSNGRVVGQGTPAEMQANESPAVYQFMHGQPDGPVPFHYPAPALVDDLLPKPTVAKC